MRRAQPTDLAAVERIVGDAYRPYVDRIGRPPAPMHADYPLLISKQTVWLLELATGEVVGVLVAHVRPDHLFIENVAVDPAHQSGGHGRHLLRFAERLAAEHGLPELTLYTNEKMTENIAFYGRQGYVEVGREVNEGFSRVHFRKRLRPGENRGVDVASGG